MVYDRGSGIGFSVIVYVDLDYSGDLEKRRFLTGYVFILLGCATSWKATLQLIVALSIIEAEYMVAAKAMEVAIWLIGLVVDLQLQESVIAVFCNN